jgi:hypothetical protein
MAKIDEKIAATAFSKPTSKTFQEVRDAGQRAIKASNGSITTTSEARTVEGSKISYNVKRIGALNVMDFEVSYAEDPSNGGAIVTLQPGGYITSQSKMFLIPIGPKDAAGYGVLRKFSQKLQELL